MKKTLYLKFILAYVIFGIFGEDSDACAPITENFALADEETKADVLKVIEAHEADFAGNEKVLALAAAFRHLLGFEQVKA